MLQQSKVSDLSLDLVARVPEPPENWGWSNMVKHSTVLLVLACRHATISFLHKDVGLCECASFSRFLADFRKMQSDAQSVLKVHWIYPASFQVSSKATFSKKTSVFCGSLQHHCKQFHSECHQGWSLKHTSFGGKSRMSHATEAHHMVRQVFIPLQGCIWKTPWLNELGTSASQP